MKIIDCFTFYKELDILNYRLSILYPIVDYFVIIEATKTHTGKEKPLFFEENKEHFTSFLDKIIHVIDDKLIDSEKFGNGVDAWTNENHQRNSIELGLKRLELMDDDKIIISDADEIPDPIQLSKIKNENLIFDKYKLVQDLYYYNLTCKLLDKWCLSEIISYHYYKNVYNNTPQNGRYTDSSKLLSPGGWHLSYFGDLDFIQNKIDKQAHQEFNNEFIKDKKNIEDNINNCKDLYSRDFAQMEKISISDNKYLPPEYDKYFEVTNGSIKHIPLLRERGEGEP